MIPNNGKNTGSNKGNNVKNKRSLWGGFDDILNLDIDDDDETLEL